MPHDTQDPSLLFLPGTGADPNFWRPVGERLPTHWQKTYLGWPGLGHNAPDSSVTSFADLVLLAERKLLELAQGGRQVDVIAQSMGGAIALALALAQPELIGRLVLTVAAGGMDVERLGAIDWRPSYREEYPEAAEWLYAARPDYSLELGRIAHPTLLLWGDDDPISPPAVGEEFQRRMPNASLVVLTGGTHGLAAERPDEVACQILDHLVR